MTVKRYDLVGTTYHGEAWREMEESDDGDYVLASDYDALAAKCDRWRTVARDVCGHMDLKCPPGCDSYGHVEGCGVYDLCVTVKNLRERLAVAEPDAERWRNARRLADDISDPTLRGIVITFLDRFGTAT